MYIGSDQKLNIKNLIFTFGFTIFAIAVNYCGSLLAETIVFPLYLDSILTISLVSVCGFVPGLICALGSNILLSFFTKSSFLFSICHIMTAGLAYIVFSYYDRKKEFSIYTLDAFLWAGFWAAITNGIVGNIIVDIVFSGNTGRPSANIVVQGIYCAIPNLAFANNFGGLLENIADKILSAVLSYLVYKIVIGFRSDKSVK